MIIKNANIFREDATFQIGDIIIENDLIVESSTENSSIFDATGLYAIPGLTDIHFHGCDGYDFCDGTQEAIDKIVKYEASNGVTTICPATMSLPEDTLVDICKTISTYDNKVGSILCGINMEGPFLSVEKKGAQNEKFLCKPDIEMFRRLDEIVGQLIKIANIAPEEEGAMKFITQLRGNKVIAVAHTVADYDTAYEAFQKGANHVTHLYNAMPPFHHRDPGVIGAAFDTPDCTVELICDGIHIHPSVVRATIKMFGEDRVIFVSDSMMATGLADGKYALGGQEVNVVGKKATLACNGSIAGSATNLMDCMKNAVINMGIPLETAVKAATMNPAKRIGIYQKYGSISPGKVANIVLLDQKLNIKLVILKGIEYIGNEC